MSRFIQKIKRGSLTTGVALLSAGLGNRIRSNEPRSLIKIGGKCLLELQLEALSSMFSEPNILVGIGVESQKIVKKFIGRVRLVENQLYKTTGPFETLRLLVNSSTDDSLLVIHGDLYFNSNILDGADFSKSFVVSDTTGSILEREVGITSVNNKASILSYGLKDKWAQMAFFTGRELATLRNLCCKSNDDSKHLLTFEIINSIINKGGSFKVHKPDKTFIVEIDCMKDIKNENFNIK
jgi:choline kinase